MAEVQSYRIPERVERPCRLSSRSCRKDYRPCRYYRIGGPWGPYRWDTPLCSHPQAQANKRGWLVACPKVEEVK